MTWARFHASCRRHINRPGSRFSDTMEFYQSGASATLFGAVPGAGALPGRLMARLVRMADDAAREDALRVYAGLDFDAIVAKPVGIKRMAIYLAVLALCCIAMVSVFALFVFPELALHFQGTGMDLGQGPLAWQNHLPWVVAVVALVCVVVVVQAMALGRLLEFRLDPGGRSVLWAVLTPSLRKRYGLLEGVICAPMPEAQVEEARRELQGLWAQGLRWQDELPGLVRVQAGLLAASADRQAKWLLAIMGIVIVACVSTFVLGVYTPVFRMGGGI